MTEDVEWFEAFAVEVGADMEVANVEMADVGWLMWEWLMWRCGGG